MTAVVMIIIASLLLTMLPECVAVSYRLPYPNGMRAVDPTGN